MIEVPVYPSGYPCKCYGSCNYSKAYEDAGMPKYIDYELLKESSPFLFISSFSLIYD
tara:strand:+ start:194 stop:364 length:171 start_codon:yes stop_codon:yes gene_type:complete